ncbi:MAG: iron ABC transporter permease [Saccharofermentans sp.]|nr:iron ABC transporter permease [Saccharofermentans sp.]
MLIQLLKMRQHKDTFYLKLMVAVIATVVAVAASCCLGSSGVTIKDVVSYITGHRDELSASTVTIIGKIRIPRTITAALCGGALASVGCVMQGVFKNPMADPSVLGISSGSALGAAIAIVSGLNIVIIGQGFTGSYIGAVIGAAVTWMLVFTIARGSGEYDTSSTLLAGIAISSIMSALITVLMTLHMESMERVYLWMLGTFSGSTVTKTYVLFAVVAVCFPLLVWVSPRIDVLKLGREAAASLGVNQSRTLGIVLCLSSILLAFCVANSGIIGFVGLIIPHIVTFFRVYKARQKLIICFFTGAVFMVVCDCVAKTVVAPGEMAIGAVTSLIGAPYFLWLLISARITSRRRGIRV